MTTPSSPPSSSPPPSDPADRPSGGLARAVRAGILAATVLVVALVVVLVYVSGRGGVDPSADPGAGTPAGDQPDPRPERSIEAWCEARAQLAGMAPADPDDPLSFREDFEQLVAGNLALSGLAPPEIRDASNVLAELWTEVIEQIDRRGLWQDPPEAVDVLGELLGPEQQAALEAVEQFADTHCP